MEEGLRSGGGHHRWAVWGVPLLAGDARWNSGGERVEQGGAGSQV